MQKLGAQKLKQRYLIFRTILSFTICSISARSAEVAPSSDFKVRLETCRFKVLVIGK